MTESERELSRIKRAIRELTTADRNPHQMDTDIRLEDFEYRGRLVEIRRTPNMMRSGEGMRDYTVMIWGKLERLGFYERESNQDCA